MSLIFVLLFFIQRERVHVCGERGLRNVGRIRGAGGDLSSQILLHAEWTITIC